jgi:ribosome-associated translation inhibitor RaiA
MASMDFYVDFNIEVPSVQEEFSLEAEQQLRRIASGHSDIVGAAVSLESIVKTETQYLYQVRIVVYKRPEDIAIIEKDSEPMIALNNALDALEEKIRASREKLTQNDSHRNEEIETVFYELTPDEVYATYAKNQKPTDVINKNRDEIATELMVKEGLTEEAAYFAADQIMFVAQKNTSQGEE